MPQIIAAIIAIYLVIIVVYLIMIAMIWLVGMTIIVAAIVGGSVSLYNYGLAFKNNVKLEKPTL